MEFKPGVDPGQHNKYEEANFGERSQYIKEPTQVNIFNTDKNTAARIAGNMARVRQELGKELSERTRQQVEFYETKIKGTKDVEQKLTDGGFKPSAIKEAKRLKEFWAKEAFRTSDYPVIQEDNLLYYTRIVHEFGIYIMPMIEDGKPVREIMVSLHEKIVQPIMDIFRDNGYSDQNLRYNYDHIYGMIYYLTGNCHLNWTDYDEDLELCAVGHEHL